MLIGKIRSWHHLCGLNLPAALTFAPVVAQLGLRSAGLSGLWKAPAFNQTPERVPV
jgi:hypothetical protein